MILANISGHEPPICVRLLPVFTPKNPSCTFHAPRKRRGPSRPNCSESSPARLDCVRGSAPLAASARLSKRPSVGCPDERDYIILKRAAHLQGKHVARP